MYGKIVKLQILFLLLLLAFPLKIFATSITFTAQVGDTILILKGFTSPNSLVSFSENNTIIGTTSSDLDGNFEKEFTAQNPGLHSITITSSDPTNNTTAGIEKDIVLIFVQTTEIDDILLPPTIRIDKPNYNSTDNIQVDGYAKPFSYIEINITGAVGKSTIIQADGTGYYQNIFESKDFIPGDYKVSAIIQGSLNQDLNASSELSFIINSNGEPQGGSTGELPGGGGSGTGELPCPYPYPLLCFFDKVKKGYLDQISELQSVLLGVIKYYHHNEHNVYDINEDGFIGEIDLSIALYYTKSAPYEVLGLTDVHPAEIKIENSNILGLSALNKNTSVDTFLENLIKNESIIGVLLVGVFIILFILRKILNATRRTKQYK